MPPGSDLIRQHKRVNKGTAAMFKLFAAEFPGSVVDPNTPLSMRERFNILFTGRRPTAPPTVCPLTDDQFHFGCFLNNPRLNLSHSLHPAASLSRETTPVPPPPSHPPPPYPLPSCPLPCSRFVTGAVLPELVVGDLALGHRADRERPLCPVPRPHQVVHRFGLGWLPAQQLVSS